jgi:hypothetical protein
MAEDAEKKPWFPMFGFGRIREWFEPETRYEIEPLRNTPDGAYPSSGPSTEFPVGNHARPLDDKKSE